MPIDLLKSIGFSDKTANIYLSLLALGPSSVRALAQKTELNRGTVYDSLKWMKGKGVIDYYEKDKKQYFVVENPEKLHRLVQEQQKQLQEADNKLDKIIPELKSVYDKGGDRPIAKYYNRKQVSKILEDILEACEADEEKTYRIYSSAGIREYLYNGFETFSDVRIAKGIAVKAIAIGQGGELRGLDERKWLQTKEKGSPTYILIYPGKTAYVSLDAKGEPVGVVIENEGVYQTQKIIFENLWKKI